MRDARGQFLPGSNGNPRGRPVGARNKLGEAFIQALADDFALHGANVIKRVRMENPAAYLRTLASILPKAQEDAVSVEELALEMDRLAKLAMEQV